MQTRNDLLQRPSLRLESGVLGGKMHLNLHGPVKVRLRAFDAEGKLIHPREIEGEASKRSISLRTGCHCNPGAGETALHITEEHMASLFRAKERKHLERFLHAADAMKEGAVRASLGIVSNAADVDAFLEFAELFVDQPSEKVAGSAPT